MERQVMTAVHFGTIGDVIASIPAMRQAHKLTGKMIVLYLMKNTPAKYYQENIHPTRDENGKEVFLNQDMIDMMIPFFKAQSFMKDVLVHEEGQHIDLDLNMITKTFVNQPYHSLAKWYFYCYPDLTCDLSIPYIDIPDTDVDFGTKGKLIVARTARYNNDKIDYSFLKRYEDNLIFSGTMREYNNFCMSFDLNIPKLTISNFLELAQSVKQASGLLSNQTMIAQIAEGIKSPRVVELCQQAPNVCFQGANGYEFYNDYAAEYFVSKILGVEKEFIERLKKEKAAEATFEKSTD